MNDELMVTRMVKKKVKRLKEGVLRRISVNLNWLDGGNHKKYVISEGKKESFYDMVKILGPSAMKSGSKEVEVVGCGYSRTERSAWLETKAAIDVG
jgi:hypothetical protein